MITDLILEKIPIDTIPKVGSKVIHIHTLEVGEVVGPCMSFTKLSINFPGSHSNYPSPKRNLRLIIQQD